MSRIEDALRAAEFSVVRKGYAPDEVRSLLAQAADSLAELEAGLRAAGVRERSLQRELASVQRIEADPAAVFLSASEAKERLLEEAKAEAERIVEQARSDTAADSHAASRTAVDKALEEAAAVEAAARAYAEAIIADARSQAHSGAASGNLERESLHH